MQSDCCLELVNDNTVISLPSEVALLFAMNDKLISFDARPMWFEARDYQSAHTLRVTKPKFVFRQEPKLMMGGVQVSETAHWVWCCYPRIRYILLHESLPVNVGNGVFSKEVARRRNMRQLKGFKPFEDGIDQFRWQVQELIDIMRSYRA